MEIKLHNESIQLGNFGVEIECYNLNISRFVELVNAAGVSCRDEGYNHDTRPHWKVVPDGSIHGEQAGEVVSPILNGEDGMNQLAIVCAALKEVGAKVNKSTGLHVHHDASQLRQKDLLSVLRFYCRAERYIDMMMPESRRENNGHYCRSTRMAVDTIQSGQRIQDMSRYYKVNLTSFYRHGTIEFRQHSGTVEFDKISNWVIFTRILLHAGQTTQTRTMKIWDDLTYLKIAMGITSSAGEVAHAAFQFMKNRAKELNGGKKPYWRLGSPQLNPQRARARAAV